MLATRLLSECPTAAAFARTAPRRLAKLRYDGRHKVGEDLAGRLVEAAKRSVGQYHGPVYDLQARHICQDIDPCRRRLKELESDMGGLLDAHDVVRLLTSIDGIGPILPRASSPLSASQPASGPREPSPTMSASCPPSGSRASARRPRPQPGSAMPGYEAHSG